MMKKFWKLILILTMVGTSAHADLYDVTGIPVRAERDTVQEARQAAITDAQTEAFWSLMNKMVAPDDVARISLPDEATLTDFVQNVSVADEKMTATKYMATFSVRFHPNKVQDFLTQNQIPFLTQSLPSTVVIPVFKKDGEALLLEENNPVYTFLRNNSLSQPLCEITVPVGDLEEIGLARDTWLSGDLSAFQSFANRYRTDRVLLFFVEQRGPYVSATTQSFPPLPDESLLTSVDVMTPTGRLTDVLPEVWKRVMDKQLMTWRLSKTNNFTRPEILWIRVPITSLSQWVQIQNRLKKIPAFETAQVRGFRPNEVLITLSGSTSGDNLGNLLAAQKIRLTETGVADVYILRLTSATERSLQ